MVFEKQICGEEHKKIKSSPWKKEKTNKQKKSTVQQPSQKIEESRSEIVARKIW